MFSLSAPESTPLSEASVEAGHRRLKERAVERGLRRRRDEAEATVEAAMEAGRTLIQRDGLLDFNMRELLALSGVSNRAFYRHFPTKEALVVALAGEVYDTLLETLAAAVAARDTPVAEFEAWVDAALMFARDPALASRGRVFVAYEPRLREEYSDLYRSVGRTLTAQVAGILERGRAARVFSDDAGLGQARLAVRLVIATLEHHVFERSIPSATERDGLVSMILRACAPTTSVDHA
jgi:AcrR family transcriptional regulator